MSDFLTTNERSALMSVVRNKDTAPERFVRRHLWRAGFRYRLHARQLPGSPDLVLPRFRTVVFVQGCFWHRHDCRKGRSLPKANREFWRRKLLGNVKRDRQVHDCLRGLGWTVYLVWECNLLEDTEKLLSHLTRMADQHSKGLDV